MDISLIGGRETPAGKVLRNHRVRAGLTQEELAELANISGRSVSDIERGKQHPTPSTARRLAEGIGLTGEERSHFIEALVSPKRIAEDAPPRQGGRSASGAHRGLPAPLTNLVGRADDVSVLLSLLSEDENRLLVLAGPGGVGKTRLAIEVGWRATERVDVVVYIPLATVVDRDGMLSAVRSALGISGGADAHTLESLSEALDDRRVLLILDNFEHLLEARSDVGRLLALYPDLTILCTSRERLHIYGERKYPVKPLQVTREGQAGSMTSLSDSAQLFAHRAEMARHGFAITLENLATLEEICRRVDGLPLALELAAARTASLALTSILGGLAKHSDILSDGPDSGDVRHRSLQATIDWSYGLLTADERRLFRRLSVFRGSFTPEAAAAVSSETGRADVPATVTSLLNKCLIERSPVSENRFFMLETLRQYSHERLQDISDFKEVLDRHASYYGTWLRELHYADSRLTWQEFFDVMDWESGNIDAAMDHAWHSGNATLAFEMLGFQLIVRLDTHATPWPVWSSSLLDVSVQEPVKTRILMLGRSMWGGPTFGPSTADRRQLLIPANKLLEIEHPLLSPWLLTSIAGAMTYFWSPSRSPAPDYWTDSHLGLEYLLAAREHLDPENPSRFLGVALMGLVQATDYFGECDFKAAKQSLEEVLALERRRKDALGITWALHSLADLNAVWGHCEEAFAQCEEVAAGYKRATFVREVAETELQLLILALQMGWHEEVDKTVANMLELLSEQPYRLLSHLVVGIFALSLAARGMAHEAGLVAGAYDVSRARNRVAGHVLGLDMGDFELHEVGDDSTWQWRSMKIAPLYNLFVGAMQVVGAEEYAVLRREGARGTLGDVVGAALENARKAGEQSAEGRQRAVEGGRRPRNPSVTG